MRTSQAEFPISVMRECTGDLHQRLLRMAQTKTFQTGPTGQDADRENQADT